MLRHRYTERLRRSSRAVPCPVCGGQGCGQSATRVLCFRVEEGSTRRANSGAWLHYEVKAGMLNTAPRIEIPTASIERRDAVYSELLKNLTLTERHFQHLATALPELL